MRLLLIGSIALFSFLLWRPKLPEKCHHDGRLDHIDPKKTVRVDASRYVKDMIFEIGVCKICGAITDEKRVGPGYIGHIPIAGGDTNFARIIWNPDKEAQELERKSIEAFIKRLDASTNAGTELITRSRSSTNAIIIKDCIITTDKIWTISRDNEDRFVLITGCTITAAPEPKQGQLLEAEIGTNGWEAKVWVEWADTP